MSGQIFTRIATQADEDDIFFLLVGMAAENAKQSVNVHKSIETIRHVISTNSAIVAEKDGQIIGSVGVGVKAPWFSLETFLGDYWFYVHPDHRSSRAAAVLKKAIDDFAQRAGMDLVMAVFSETDAERKSEFFARDMRFLGGAYIRDKE